MTLTYRKVSELSARVAALEKTRVAVEDQKDEEGEDCTGVLKVPYFEGKAELEAFRRGLKEGNEEVAHLREGLVSQGIF